MTTNQDLLAKIAAKEATVASKRVLVTGGAGFLGTAGEDAMTRDLNRLLEKAERDSEILAVVLYGSRARGEAHASSDLDVCLVLGGAAAGRDRGNEKRTEYLEFTGCDVRVFEQLPLYVRQRVLKDGKVLHVKDEDGLYEVAFRTIRAFEDFRPYYRQYLEQVAHAGS